MGPAAVNEPTPPDTSRALSRHRLGEQTGRAYGHGMGIPSENVLVDALVKLAYGGEHWVQVLALENELVRVRGLSETGMPRTFWASPAAVIEIRLDPPDGFEGWR